MSSETRWCGTCRTMRPVLDTHAESYYDGGSGGAREYGYTVTDLTCGHEAVTPPAPIGPAPGAPYAGPQQPTAASHRAADLAAAWRVPPDPWTDTD